MKRFYTFYRLSLSIILIATLPMSSFMTPTTFAETTTNTQQCSSAAGAAQNCTHCNVPDPKNQGVCLDDYYVNNAITMYDPNDKPCSETASTIAAASTTLAGNDRAEQIFRFLVGKGLTAAQAAGVMGNLYAESGFDPAIEEGGRVVDANYTPRGGVGFGIAQWTDPGRQNNLIAFQKSSGKTIIDLSMQLDFLWKEMNSGLVIATLKGTSTPQDAAFIFHRDYEISNDTPAQVAANRGGNAQKFYDQYKSLSVSSSGNATISTAGLINCSHTDGVLNGGDLTKAAVDPMSDSFTIYNQCQYPPYGGPWGTQQTIEGRTVCQDGCSPTALAMIAKNVAGQDVTPQMTVNYYTGQSYWVSGGGSGIDSAYKSADHYGLSAEKIDKSNLDAYKQAFAKGGVLMAISAGPSPFLPQRHAIVLRGITGDNFLIADPGRTENNKAPANQPSVNSIMTAIRSDGASAVYAFYKK